MALSKAQRAKIKPANFGVPGTDEYPINNRDRAQAALARVAANGTPAEQHSVQRRVAAKYPTMKVNGSGGNTGKPTASGAGLPTAKTPAKKTAAKKTTTAKRTASKPMRRGK
jgi:DNA end-binding protein Ku